MRFGWRKIVSVLAIYSVALNAILWAALGPVPVGASFDPLTAICHSIVDQATVEGDQSPAGQPAKPSKACDHCTLCGVAPVASSAADAVLAGVLEPGRLLRVLRPVDAARSTGVVSHQHSARGPPLSA
ncbi:hypothetical protein ASD45_08980 [Pseudolabrys sp. Root1462]|uniref:DUF2946 family protein n=1 Tax=Pseudolabrys sp. Root1462 TaxID=1736466 RepID=UPI000702AF33|nr:DUF2946 family protein [Pseudolabrys sp. Root1462]KQZ00977.1 hypothetical protein ASD45_08980 [Pseudolabrys sp. Root1462]